MSLITQRKPLWAAGGGAKKEEPTLHLVQVTHPGTKDTLSPLNYVTQGLSVRKKAWCESSGLQTLHSPEERSWGGPGVPTGRKRFETLRSASRAAPPPDSTHPLMVPLVGAPPQPPRGLPTVRTHSTAARSPACPYSRVSCVQNHKARLETGLPMGRVIRLILLSAVVWEAGGPPCGLEAPLD